MQKGTVIYAFDAQDDTEVTVKEGDIIEIVEVGGEGWSSVSINGITGLIPTEYYEVLEVEETSEPTTPQTQQPTENVVNPKKKPRDLPPPSMTSTKAKGFLQKQIAVNHRVNKLRAYTGKKEFRGLKQRANLLQELLETERTYVTNLTIFMDYFLTPLKKSAKEKKKILTEAQIKDIFSNLEQIHQINTMFLLEVEKTMKKFPQENKMGKVCKDLFPFFKSYTVYINNYDKAFQSQLKYEKSIPAFADFLQEQYNKKETHRHKLESFLIMPVQRIPRYKMLFQDLLKNTPDNFPDKADVSSALSLIADIAMFVNEGKRQNENSKLLKELAKLLKEKYSTLVQSHRQFKKETVCQLTYPKYEKHGESYKAYLFQDMLVLLEAKEKKMSKRSVYFILLAFANIVPSQSTVEIRLDIFNEGDRRLIYIAFSTEEEKQDWVNMIQESIENEKSTVQNKGIDCDLIKLGTSRTEVRKNVDENLRQFKIITTNFESSKSNLLKMDADILNHERQLQALQQQIAKEKEGKRKIEETLVDLTSDQNNLMSELQNNLKQILEKDKIFTESLKGEEEAVFQILGEKPSTEQEQQKLLPVIQEYVPKVQFKRETALPTPGKPLPSVVKKPLPNPKSLPELPPKRQSAIPPKRQAPSKPPSSLDTKSSPSKVQSTSPSSSSPVTSKPPLPAKTSSLSSDSKPVVPQKKAPVVPSRDATSSPTQTKKPFVPSRTLELKKEEKSPSIPVRTVSSPTLTKDTSNSVPSWKKNIKRRDSGGSTTSSTSSTGRSVKEMIEQQNNKFK
eukprot:gene11797-5131_t